MNERNQIQPSRLRELREEMGLTQAALSRKVHAGQGGINQSAIAQVERGMTGFKAETLGEVADVLCTSTDYLLGRTDDPTPYSDVEEQVILVERDPERRDRLQRLFAAIGRLPDGQRREYLDMLIVLYRGVVTHENSV